MKLVARQGMAPGSEFALDKPVLIVGRSADADIAVPDPKISRRHAEIRLMGERISITDLGSVNGTFVNGAQIRGTQSLRVGDEIRVGNVTFGVQEGLAQASSPGFVAGVEGWGEPPATGRSSKLIWALVGIGALLVVAVVAGLLVVRSRGGQNVASGHTPTVKATVVGATPSTPTRPAVVVAPTAATSQTPGPGEVISPTATIRSTPLVTQTSGGGGGQSGTPAPQTAPFTVSWTHGGYEGWADGRRMSSDLTIENVSLPQISPPYQPYFIISDANGAMRVGELHDYSSASNPLPTLARGQRVRWTWFTTMSNQEWVRGSVFRYGGWSWAQEFNPDGSLNGPPRMISDQQLIPFLPKQIPPEQLATVLPLIAPTSAP